MDERLPGRNVMSVPDDEETVVRLLVDGVRVIGPLDVGRMGTRVMEVFVTVIGVVLDGVIGASVVEVGLMDMREVDVGLSVDNRVVVPRGAPLPPSLGGAGENDIGAFGGCDALEVERIGVEIPLPGGGGGDGGDGGFGTIDGPFLGAIGVVLPD